MKALLETMASDVTRNLLVVVIDTNPVWWGKKVLTSQGNELQLVQCLDAVMAFCNAHLMMDNRNRLSVIAAHNNISKFLYPKRDLPGEEPGSGGGEEDELSSGTPSERDGQYEEFSRIDAIITEEMRDLVLNDAETELHSDTLLAGAICLGLCYINRLKKENVTKPLSSRILVIKGAEDNSAQYMHFMNVIFTAQKQNIVIDVCILGHESGLLQQASDITGGIYLVIPQTAGLLQYLLWVFLSDPVTRDKLNLPPKGLVDYRAACFCHRNLIDIGYVCSVCLSMFCTFSPICSTCQTKFTFLGPMRSLKKKTKRSNPA